MGDEGAGEVGHLSPAAVVVAGGQRHGAGIGVGAEGDLRRRVLHHRPEVGEVAGEQVAAEADPVEDARLHPQGVDHVEEPEAEAGHLAEAGAVELVEPLAGALEVGHHAVHVVAQLAGGGGAGGAGAAEEAEGEAAHGVAGVGVVEGVEAVLRCPVHVHGLEPTPRPLLGGAVHEAPDRPGAAVGPDLETGRFQLVHHRPEGAVVARGVDGGAVAGGLGILARVDGAAVEVAQHQAVQLGVVGFAAVVGAEGLHLRRQLAGEGNDHRVEADLVPQPRHVVGVPGDDTRGQVDPGTP